MPARQQSIPPAPPPALAPGVSPPIINPDHFESYPCFRETFLLLVTDGPANKALRMLGLLLHAMVMEYGGRYWPGHREGETRAEIRAAVADLRHLQGFLALAGQGSLNFKLSPNEMNISAAAGDLAPQVGAIADELEGALRRWRGETHGETH